MKHIYDKSKPDLIRYKIVAVVNGEQLIFKRYGSEETAVKKEFMAFVHELYDTWCDIQSIEEDKTYPIDE